MLKIESAFPDLELGESIAVNGVCLTVTAFDSTGLADFYVSAETLARTAFDQVRNGARVNLERATTLSTRLSGHIVQGHVDGVGRLHAVTDVGDCHHVIFRLPQSLRRYVVEKGSITLDGVSLTVNSVGNASREVTKEATREGRADAENPENDFEIALMIIPHTWTHTGFSDIALGGKVNVEVDVLAKYVENLMRYGSPS